VPFGGRHTATVRQEPALIPDLTVAENAMLAMKLAGVGPVIREGRMRHLLDVLGVSSLADRAVRHLSGGQYQRAAILRALVVEPRILLLDEPTTGLDSDLGLALARHISDLLCLRPVPIIVLVTHDRDFCFRLADHLVVIDEGQVLWAGATSEAVDAPDSARACEILGLHFILRGEVEGAVLRLPSVRAGAPSLSIPLPHPAASNYWGRVVTIAAPRARATLTLLDSAHAESPSTHALHLPGSVVHVGPDAQGRPQVDVELTNGELLTGLSVPGGMAKPAVTTKVGVSLPDFRFVSAQAAREDA
jgi:ABC-type sugar transport system ATPase subunit